MGVKYTSMRKEYMPGEGDSPEISTIPNPPKEHKNPLRIRPEQTLEHLEHISVSPPPEQPAISIEKAAQLDDLVAEARGYELLRKTVEEKMLSEKALKRLQNEDPAAYANYVRAGIELMLQPPKPTFEEKAGEKTEPIKVQTVQGTEMTLFLPESDDGKMRWMRDRLAFAEKTQESFGSSENFTYLSDVFLVIRKLQKRGLDKNIPIEEGSIGSAGMAENMKRELMARAALHDFSLIYTKTTSADAISESAPILKAEHFNTLFKIPEIRKAFLIYENRAREFLAARGQRKIDIQQEIAREIGNGDVVKGEWAQRIAERLWRITGRAAFHDGLRPRDPQKPEEVEFIGEGSGGDFVLRRVFKFKEWLQTSRKSTPVAENLLPYVDLKAVDFWSQVAGSLEGNILKQLRGQFSEDELAQDPKQFKQKLGVENDNEFHGCNTLFEYLKHRAEQTIGSTLGIKKEEIEVGAELKWPKSLEKIGQLDMSNIDFNLLGEGFYGTYVYFNIASPEKARDALVGKTSSFLRQPSYDGLKQLVDIFGYQQADQYETKARLLEGFLRLAMSDEAKNWGLIKTDRMTADGAINNSKNDLGLPDQQRDVLRSRILGTSLISKARTILSSFRIMPGILASIWEFVTGFFKQVGQGLGR